MKSESHRVNVSLSVDQGLLISTKAPLGFRPYIKAQFQAIIMLLVFTHFTSEFSI